MDDQIESGYGTLGKGNGALLVFIEIVGKRNKRPNNLDIRLNLAA